MSLERFVEAQRDTYAAALAELRAGAKRSHWMWFVFPQIAGLGRSETARKYAIRDLAEARAYLAHPLLGHRLVEAAEAMLAHADAGSFFGPSRSGNARSCVIRDHQLHYGANPPPTRSV